MQKRFLFVFGFFFISVMFIFNSQAHAIGIGGYLTSASGSYDLTYENQDTDYETEDSTTISKIGYGFILDTAVQKDTLFNYRLNLGYSFFSLKGDDFPDVDGSDYHVYNSFGFRIIRTDKIRFWVGPQIGLGFLYGEYDEDEAGDTSSDFGTFYYTLGAVAGMNINIVKHFSIGVDGGYRLASHIGGCSIGDNDYDVYGSGGEFFASVSAIATFGEN